jgi:cold shock CspA family protein
VESEPQPIRLKGTLIRLRDSGFGFIHVRDGGDYYVHISNMRHRAEWIEGQSVSFVPGEGSVGKAPPAKDVVAIAPEVE